MTEKEVLKMIKESAEKEKMPDALRPERIRKKSRFLSLPKRTRESCIR